MKAVGYIRVSSAGQVADGESLERQEEKIRAYATLKGITDLQIIADRGISGSKSNRPGFLKLKELAYMHAEGFAAGELKHGPIALIEEGIPVFVVVPPKDDELHDKIVSNIQEVRARGALTIVLAEEGDESINEFADIGPATCDILINVFYKKGLFDYEYNPLELQLISPQFSPVECHL